MSAPLPLRTYRVVADDRLHDWRLAHRKYVDHIHRCPDCGGVLCKVGSELMALADEAERGMSWARRRTAAMPPIRRPEPPTADPASGDYAPAWLHLVTLTVVVLFAFGLGIVIGHGGLLP